MRTVESKLNTFMLLYEKHLPLVIEEFPDQYPYPVTEAPLVCERMRAALERGTYNYDGHAFKRTCRDLGIKHARCAIETFLLTP